MYSSYIYIKEDCKPVRQPQRRMNPTLKDIIKEELQKLLDAGFIYPISDCEWVSPLVLVPKKNVEIYMDDFTPYGSNFQEALSNLGKVLDKCIEMNLSLSPEKCEFLMTEGTVLGHAIYQQGLQVDPNKVAIIQRVPPPQKVRDVRSFLGLARYYRRFIKDFSKLASLLFGILGKDTEFIWSANCQEALDTLKSKLMTAPILRGPNWALPFHIHTNASNKAIGAALGQIDENLPYAIYFISKNLSKAELNYTVTEKELLAVMHSLNKFRHYIIGYQIFVHTDHATIRYLMNKPDVNARIIRWLLLLQQFDLTIVDKPDQILRRCVREEEVFDILLTCHDEPCGGHFVAKRTAFKILQAGYYWPTLHQYVRRYPSRCDQCQRMGKPTPKDEMPVQPQVTFEPFEKWGMDFVGPINPPSKQKQYIIVCTDYLTKWVETKAIKEATEEKVAEFLRENIFYKFGYPRELVTYHGSQFTSNLIEDLLTHHTIKNRTFTPYHP
eukprot:PITA_20193